MSDVLNESSRFCPNDYCQMDLRVNDLDEAFLKARQSKSFFWHYFMLRCPHPGQAKFIANSEATINALACSNRYGKTTLLAGEHFHACFYKTGAEPRYMTDAGDFLIDRWRKERYRTVHTAGEWDQAAEVWEDATQIVELKRMAPFIADAPRSKPPFIKFANGSRWLFRTLGNNASGIDGKNFYVLSIDEAGWNSDLDEMMRNVLRVRVADVRGRIIIVGTFKPGVSKDFYKVCVRASAYTGVGLSFDHRSADAEEDSSLDAAVRRYAEEFGFDLDAELEKLKKEGRFDGV